MVTGVMWLIGLMLAMLGLSLIASGLFLAIMWAGAAIREHRSPTFPMFTDWHREQTSLEALTRRAESSAREGMWP